MVANPNIFDGGIFLLMLIIGFVSMAFYTKFGALILVVPVILFLISGLVVVIGDDVTFFKNTIPANVTTVTKNSSQSFTITTTMTKIVASNQTSYLIGNGQFPIVGSGQLVLGYSLILLSLLIAIIFLDQVVKGNLVKG